ncbi:MAG: PqiB family protein [Burkholderiales bacterium]
MAESTDRDRLPQASVLPPKHLRISAIWIIPLVAALVAIGIAFQRIVAEGPTVTIIFKSAEGIEAGKTFVKYKDVNIGQVIAVELTQDYGKVEVTAKITRRAGGLMVEDAKFWIVKPRITLSGVSGLNTLLSGNYIGFAAGKSDKPQRRFMGLDVPPIVTDEPGRRFVLRADELGWVGVGSPVYYRRLQVGKIAAYDFAPDGKSVEIAVFINAPHDRYVTTETRFWNASGLDVSTTATGLELRLESVVALLVGGIAFDMPPFVTEAPPAPENTVFALYRDEDIAMKAPDASTRRYVLYFHEPVGGLAVGVPMTFLGLRAGEVTSVGLVLDPATAHVRPRVAITFNPERLIEDANGAAQPLGQDPRQLDILVRRLVEERGLRAQLKTGNLLTGQVLIAFNYVPNAPRVRIDMSQPVPVLPVVPSGRVDIEAKVSSILAKLDQVRFESIAGSLKQDLDGFNEMLKDARKLVSDVDVQLVPQLKKNLETMQRTLAAAERAIDHAETRLLGPNALAQQELRDALQEFARAARSVRVLTDYLERHPESLIRGKRNSTGGQK